MSFAVCLVNSQLYQCFVKLFYFLCNLPMLLNAYIENYAELFTNIDAKMANIILEMIFVENRINNKDIGLNLNFYGW